MRGGARPGAVPLAIMVQPFRLERRSFACFQYACYFRTMIYLVARRLAVQPT